MYNAVRAVAAHPIANGPDVTAHHLICSNWLELGPIFTCLFLGSLNIDFIFILIKLCMEIMQKNIFQLLYLM